MSRRNYSEKNVWGEFRGEKFSEGGDYCPDGNYLGVIIWG